MSASSKISSLGWGKLFGLEKLVAETKLSEATLRRVLRGEHESEPLRALEAIANATKAWASHRRALGAPQNLEDWRALWATQHGKRSTEAEASK